MRNCKLLITTLIIFYRLTASAETLLCQGIFSANEFLPTPTLQQLVKRSPEIEAKFLIPNREKFENLKQMLGQEIALTDTTGQVVVFQVELNKIHIYKDTNYDTKKLELFQKRGMLRRRIRMDYNSKKEKFEFSKAVFQAKNGPSENQGLNDAIFARTEIRGTEYKKLNKFEKKQDAILKQMIEDEAVSYARDFSESEKKLKPVLDIVDHRFFMTIKPKISDQQQPSIYVSLDDVTYKGLVGKKGVSQRLELEVEIVDDLTMDSELTAQSKIFMLNQLTNYLQESYSLKSSPESKYESGIKLTVLKNK